MPRPRPPAKEGLAAPEPGVEGGGVAAAAALIEEEEGSLAMMVDTSLCGAGLFSSRDVDAVSLTGARFSSSEVATVVSRGGRRAAGGGGGGRALSESVPAGEASAICGATVSDGASFSCCCC